MNYGRSLAMYIAEYPAATDFSSGAYLLRANDSNLIVTGRPKEWVMKGESGGAVRRYFCDVCGS
jgi:hypothetical protein